MGPRRALAISSLLAVVIACGDPKAGSKDDVLAAGDAEAGWDAASAAADAAGPGLDAALAGEDARPAGPDAGEPDAGPHCVPECAAGQACLDTTCVAVARDALCGLGSASELTSGNTPDDAVADAVVAALVARCGASFTLTRRSLADPAVFASWVLPTPHGELVVTAGGPFYNPLVKALETARRSPLFFGCSGGMCGWSASGTGQTVHAILDTSRGPTSDSFAVELFSDGGGRLVLMLYGIGLPGTQAAGRWTSQWLSAEEPGADTWFVYDWSVDADAGTETFTKAASGPAD